MDWVNKSDQTGKELSKEYLVFIKAALLCDNYKESWKRLSELIIMTGLVTTNNHTLITIFQIYLLGCSVAFYVHKLSLAVYFGNR